MPYRSSARVTHKQLPKVITTTKRSYHPERCTGRLYSAR